MSIATTRAPPTGTKRSKSGRPYKKEGGPHGPPSFYKETDTKMTNTKAGPQNTFAPAGMERDDAEKVTNVLQGRLAELIDLLLTLKHVHWNVVGSGFIAIHELMDRQHAVVGELMDEVAERITTMGAIAAGLTGQVVDNRDSQQDYALGKAPIMAHLGALDKVYERVCSGHRRATEKVSDLDPVSEDLLIGQTAKLDLNHWFVRAHLEDTAGHLATQDAKSEIDAAVAGAQAQPDFELVEGPADS